jgi:hypothetical protein
VNWTEQLALFGLTCSVSVTAWADAGQCVARVATGAVESSATLAHAVTAGTPRTTQRPTRQRSEFASASVCLHLSIRTANWWVDARTIRQEIVRIWQSNGVTVLSPDRRGECTQPTGQTVLLVLVDEPRDLGKPVIVSVSPEAVGATVNLNDVPTNLIMAFAERAVAAVQQVARCSVSPSRCVSLLLGRVIAHELGHVLLRTTVHVRDGLMRPAFNERDFEDEPGDRYLLTAVEREMVLGRRVIGTVEGEFDRS